MKTNTENAPCTPLYETVYTIDDYHDSPRRGIADYLGHPHTFQCLFDEATDDWSNQYVLIALPPAIFKLAMEHGRSGCAGEELLMLG